MIEPIISVEFTRGLFLTVLIYENKDIFFHDYFLYTKNVNPYSIPKQHSQMGPSQAHPGPIWGPTLPNWGPTGAHMECCLGI